MEQSEMSDIEEQGQEREQIMTRSRSRRSERDTSKEQENIERVCTSGTQEKEKTQQEINLYEFLQIVKEENKKMILENNKQMQEMFENENRKRQEEAKEMQEEIKRKLDKDKQELTAKLEENQQKLAGKLEDIETNVKKMESNIQQMAEKHVKDITQINTKVNQINNDMNEAKGGIEVNRIQIIEISEKVQTHEKNINSINNEVQNIQERLENKVSREELDTLTNQNTATHHCTLNTEMICQAINSDKENNLKFNCTERMIPAEFIERLTSEVNKFGKYKEWKSLVEKSLKDEAALWYTLHEQKFTDFNDFITKFTDEFDGIRFQNHVLNKLQNDRYREAGKMTELEYLNHLIKLIKAAKLSISEHDITIQISKHFGEHTLNAVKNYLKPNITLLIEFIKKNKVYGNQNRRESTNNTHFYRNTNKNDFHKPNISYIQKTQKEIRERQDELQEMGNAVI